MSKAIIQNAIHIKCEKIELIKNTKSKSDVWNKFRLIKFENNLVDFVCCIECKIVLAYQCRSGTGTLSRHKCFFRAVAAASCSQQKIVAFAVKPLPKTAIDNLAKKQLALVAKDLHSLGVTEGKCHQIFLTTHRR